MVENLYKGAFDKLIVLSGIVNLLVLNMDLRKMLFTIRIIISISLFIF